MIKSFLVEDLVNGGCVIQGPSCEAQKVSFRLNSRKGLKDAWISALIYNVKMLRQVLCSTSPYDTHLIK